MNAVQGWCRASIGELATEVRNGISAKPDAASGVPILRISAVRPMRLDVADVRFLDGDPAAWQTYALEADDLLFTRYNGNPQLVGVCARVAAQPQGMLVYPDKLIRVRVNRGVVEPAFLEVAVHVGESRRAIDEKLKTSAGQVGISGSDLKGIEVPLAPLNEQRRIIAKLSTVRERSRRAREALDEVPALLEKLRQSILAAAFRGDLTKDWRAKNPDVEPAEKLLRRIRTERRKKWEEAELAKLKAKGKPPTNDRWKEKYREPDAADTAGLAELPSGWCWASLDELTFLVGGITKGQRRKGNEVLRSVPYLRVANVQRGRLDLDEMKEIEATEDEIEELRLLPGDILLNEGGDRDKLGRGWIWEGQISECIHQNHVFRARPVSQGLQPKLISHYANLFGQLFFIDQGKQTTNLASVSMTRVRRLPVMVAPEAEQPQIVERIERELDMTARIRGLVGSVSKEVMNLDRAVLSKAFRGELVPQDPADEPADVMLARLKASAGSPASGPAPSPASGKRRGRPRKA